MVANVDASAGGVSVVEVGTREAGQRIDNFLARRLRGVPRSHIYRILRTGQVRVNSARARPAYRLRAGDRVRIPPVRLGAKVRAGAPPAGLLARVRAAVVDDAHGFLVVDKPPGLAVHGGTGVRWGLIEALRAAFPERQCLELVHRLDRETSGVLLVATDPASLRWGHRMLRAGSARKRYLALLAGRLPGGETVVDAPLARGQARGGERLSAVSAAGRAAHTVFRPLARHGDLTLVEVSIGTGRTHQIRVHAAHIGHPVAGDTRYGDRTLNRRLRALGLRRLFLHASDLALPLPDGGELVASCPLAEDLRAVLAALEGAVA